MSELVIDNMLVLHIHKQQLHCLVIILAVIAVTAAFYLCL